MTIFEPVVLLALAPVLWFPKPWTATLLFAVVPLLWLFRRHATGRFSVRTPYDAPVIFLLLILPLTLFPVVDWAVALPKIFALLLGCALTYAVANATTELGNPQKAVHGVLLLGVGIGIFSLVGTEWPGTKLVPLQALYERLPQLVQGLVPHTSRGGLGPNEVGGVLTLFLPIALAAVIGCTVELLRPSGQSGHQGIPGLARQARSRTDWGLEAGFSVAAAVFLGFLIVLTQSRSAYVGSAVGVFVVLIWALVLSRSTVKARLLSAAAILPLGVAAAAWLWQLVRAWVADSGTGLDSFPGRMEVWNRAWYMIQDFPFTGIGMGQFSLVLHALYVPFLTGPDEYVPHAHNFFLQLALDLGIPGATAVAFLLGGFIYAVLKTYRSSTDRWIRAASVGLASGMLAYLTYGVTDAVAIGARGGIGLWVVLGLGAAFPLCSAASDGTINER